MPKNILSLRPAKTADAERLIDLFIQMADCHHRLDHTWNKGDKETIKKLVRKLLKRGKGDLLLVLLVNKNIVGYTTATIRESALYANGKIGHIGSVYIEKPYRKLGLATLAVDESLKWFRKNKITHVDLNVDVKNHIGIAAWKKLGFTEWRLTLRRKIYKYPNSLNIRW
jgi:ribosomal protein S18 acetylase RimI-like enzyme